MVAIDVVIERKARRALQVVARRARLRAAYIFGSQADGTADRYSDIDVAAFVDEADQWDLPQRVAIGVEVRQSVGDDVELHLFPTSSWRNPPKASFTQHILRHGKPIRFNDLLTDADDQPSA
ncbi:MAG: nucleotidyltransferase domain-containing protein [Phycisphaerales bacterium]